MSKRKTPVKPPMNYLDCECSSWATIHMASQLMGNGHNPKCEKFIPSVGGIELIRDLIKGIRWWGDQEDGVPNELWDAYAKAVFLIEGRVISE